MFKNRVSFLCKKSIHSDKKKKSLVCANSYFYATSQEPKKKKRKTKNVNCLVFFFPHHLQQVLFFYKNCKCSVYDNRIKKRKKQKNRLRFYAQSPFFLCSSQFWLRCVNVRPAKYVRQLPPRRVVSHHQTHDHELHLHGR